MFHRSITGKETPDHEPIDLVEISSISQRIKCCQSHSFPEAKGDESGAGGATDPRKPKLATTM
ncbi:hypothetical protein F2Q68_00022438 [Brassica cretica]|uniref:Uncharacterized protein n=1 Tax=Brassica cretica TaxID=69181 RepID=A0A8S9FUG3_BRACR|nr:hypothetical protein F2Q68_00022438 [Brassica cretica]